MGDEVRAYLLQAGEGRRMGDGSAPVWFKAGNPDTAGAFNFHYNESKRFGEVGTPLHIHHRDDECVLQIEGAREIIRGSQRFHLTPGFSPSSPAACHTPSAISLRPRAWGLWHPVPAGKYARLQMAAGFGQGLSVEDIFRSLPPEARIEVLGSANWGIPTG